MLVVQVILGTVLSGLVTLGWAYVATVTVGGWMAGETPKRAWVLAALGASALLGLRLIFSVLGLVPLQADQQPVVFVIIPLVSYAGWLLLAAAFALGLPTLVVRRRGQRSYGRSTGSDAARFRSRLSPSSTCSVDAYGPGIRKHGRPARATPWSCPHGSCSTRPAAISATRL